MQEAELIHLHFEDAMQFPARLINKTTETVDKQKKTNAKISFFEKRGGKREKKLQQQKNYDW